MVGLGSSGTRHPLSPSWPGPEEMGQGKGQSTRQILTLSEDIAMQVTLNRHWVTAADWW